MQRLFTTILLLFLLAILVFAQGGVVKIQRWKAGISCGAICPTFNASSISNNTAWIDMCKETYANNTQISNTNPITNFGSIGGTFGNAGGSNTLPDYLCNQTPSNRPALQFISDGEPDTIGHSSNVSSFLGGGNNYTLVTVFKPTSTTQGSVIWGTATNFGNDLFGITHRLDNFVNYHDSNIERGFIRNDDNTWYIQAQRWDGNLLTLSSNGYKRYFPTTSAPTTISSPLIVRAGTNGEIYASLVYARAITDGELDTINNAYASPSTGIGGITISANVTTSYSDNFDDNSLDTTNWYTDADFLAGVGSFGSRNVSTGVVSETGGQLVIGKNITQRSYNGILSKRIYNLTGRVFTVEYVQAADAANSVNEDWIGVGADRDNGYRFRQSGGTLYAQRIVNLTFTTIASAPYNATNYRWLRIRESSGVILFDTSPDNVTWTNFASQALSASLNITGVQLALQAGVSCPQAGIGGCTGGTNANTIFDNVSFQ